MDVRPKGKLVAIGGNEDKYTEHEPDFAQRANPHFFQLGILRRIVQECSVENPHVEVITTASRIPEEIGETYLNAFLSIGCERVGVMNIHERAQAGDRDFLQRISVANAVMFTGGDQFRLSSILGGTAFLSMVLQRYKTDNFVVAGTSAGAMAMSKTMIRGGNSSDALIKGQVKLGAGLGFIDGVIIDSHFVKRGRFGRLAQSVAGNPATIGLGLGEDTGVLISQGNEMEVIGSGLVIVLDGTDIQHNNISELPEGAPISIENLRVHVMALGNCYSLQDRKFQIGNPMVFQDNEN
ncbi:MAG: cyanophycinase [Bacteroidetes bacterium]|nr:cyanophycinase [Bacteroidota bacterium]